MVKLQQYYIYKFKTSRLKKSNYKINLTISQARLNAEIVSIGDSQMLETLRELKGQQNNQDKINQLFLEKKRIRNKKSSLHNSQQLLEIEKEIDDLLFVPEIISVVVEDNRHYKNIINNGLIINNHKFVRFLCGSGNARHNTVIFIDKLYISEIQRILQNGIPENIDIVPAKYNAYFSLCASASIAVSNLNFCVISDYSITRKEKVDLVIDDDPDDKIEETEIDLEFNLFDGQGLISPEGARKWSDELELDYLPATFVIRNNFLKGMVCTFDFQDLAKEKGVRLIEDIWGNWIDITKIDLVITESQFKLWESYESMDDYINNLEKNNIHWRVSRVSPKCDRHHVFSNYQFLQVLNLNNEQIKSLCDYTLEYLRKTILNDIGYTLLYLLGKYVLDNYDPNIYNRINDKITKSLILNNALINDTYIQNYILRSLNKRIVESYIGNLVIKGNYSTMIADPYAFVEHMLGLPITGLLKRNQSYSYYWNKKKKETIAACRAPLTWKSEVNILSLTTDEEKNFWYKYINSGIIYNIHGIDAMLHADSDFDGDIIMTTSQQEIIDGATGGLPIYYQVNKTPRLKLNETELYLADMSAFNSKIGFITNCSTTLYTMLSNYDINSKEYKIITDRLKLCRKEQGLQIDKAKGLVVKSFPKHWTNWNRMIDTMTDEEKEIIKFNNMILVDKRPYFMRYLYSQYSKKHKRFKENYNNYSIANFGVDIDNLSDNEFNENSSEQELIKKYNRYKPLIDNNCIMNNICHYMEKNIKEIKISMNKCTPDNIIRLLKNPGIPFDKVKFKMLYNIYKRYKSEKRNFTMIKDEYGNMLYKTLEQYNKYILQQSLKISSNISELANLAVNICYETHPNDNKNFVWNVFGEGIIKNVMLNKQSRHFVPFLGKGNLKYLGDSYYLAEIKIEKDIDENFND